MANYKTPGVYIEEIRKLPPSIAAVETAVPVFIGYTEKSLDLRGDSIANTAQKVTSLFNYERFFGKPNPEKNTEVTVNGNGEIKVNIRERSPYLMHYAMQLYFANGGGDCYVVSAGDYTKGLIDFNDLSKGLKASKKVDEVTLILFPDAQGLGENDFYSLHGEALKVCAVLKDRFTIMDVWVDPAGAKDDEDGPVSTFRDKLSGTPEELKYGAAYYPNVSTILDYYYGGDDEGDKAISIVAEGGLALPDNLAALKGDNNAFYFQIKNEINNFPMELPPSSGIAGIYASTDQRRGVWKAPANINMAYVIKPVFKITHQEQANLNVDAKAGKSINVIRSFPGRGAAIVWGARTLAGNDNEWRYVSVRRFFNMVEESTKNAAFQFVFEPNDINTWTRVKSMIDNFLGQQWKAGALQGATPEEAYYVKVGLNETMSELDIWEGRMIVEIGMAVVRPAEFIILKFSHKLLSET